MDIIPLKSGKRTGTGNWYNKRISSRIVKVTKIGVRPLNKVIKSTYFDNATMIAIEFLTQFNDSAFNAGCDVAHICHCNNSTKLIKYDNKWYAILAKLKVRNELYAKGIQPWPYNVVFILGNQITSLELICELEEKFTTLIKQKG